MRASKHLRKIAAKDNELSKANQLSSMQSVTNKSLNINTVELQKPLIFNKTRKYFDKSSTQSNGKFALPRINSTKKFLKLDNSKDNGYRKTLNRAGKFDVAASLQHAFMQKKRLDECLVKEQFIAAVHRELRLNRNNSKLAFLKDIEAQDIDECSHNSCSIGNTTFYITNQRLKMQLPIVSYQKDPERPLLSDVLKRSNDSFEYGNGIGANATEGKNGFKAIKRIRKDEQYFTGTCSTKNSPKDLDSNREDISIVLPMTIKGVRKKQLHFPFANSYTVFYLQACSSRL
eukprot:TRINITY_DN12945_c0_g1_i4.p1 TRINITY_DN12945_c0_g1~~TRINITY_DN12945_c0_g1_i4.p1  ORF type:complete len:288 (+),score=52.78 TRINITY_DN12945_c0_g1_i4:141-1004(+)